MAEDLEVGVKLVPDEQALEDVEDREVGVGGQGAGGDLAPSEQNQQQSIFGGSIKTALLSLGIVGFLANLKPITATLSSVFNVISRTLVPVIETVAELIRPFSNFASDVVEATSDIKTRENLSETFQDPFGTEFGENPTGIDAARQFNQQNSTTLSEVLDSSVSGLISIIDSVTNGGAGSPDQSDEAKKTEMSEDLESKKGEKTGATSP